MLKELNVQVSDTRPNASLKDHSGGVFSRAGNDDAMKYQC